jgi:hypothetical protein
MDEYEFSEEEERSPKWWPFALFIFILGIGIVSVFLFGGDGFDLRSPVVPSTGCVVMQDRGDYSNSVNIVFLGASYEDVEKFKQDTEIMMNGFLEVVPYNSYKERFNFFRIEEFGDYGCEYDDAIICNPSLSQKEATKCPGNDYVVVVSDYSNVKNFFKHLRSSAWRNLASLNSADDPLVFVHEFAHLFADFADEYEFGGRINWDAPNCDNVKSCPKFSEVEGSECHVGCVNSKYSRSVKVGIMRDYWTSSRYGLYNEWYLENLIKERTKSGGRSKTDGEPKESPQLVYLVSGKCVSGNCEIEDVQKSPGYITENKEESVLVVVTGSHSVNIPSDNKIIIEAEPGMENGRIIYPDEFEFSVAIPIIEDEDIDLVEDGNVIDSFNFEDRVISFGETVEIPEVNQG